MINEANIEKTKKLVIESKDKPLVVVSQDDAYNRKILEWGKFDILLFSDKNLRKNKLKQIDSGINDFIALTAKKKGITIGFDVNDLREYSGKSKAEKIMKIRQNMKICWKIGCKINVRGYKDEKDAFSLLLSLGISNKLAKEALSCKSF